MSLEPYGGSVPADGLGNPEAEAARRDAVQDQLFIRYAERLRRGLERRAAPGDGSRRGSRAYPWWRRGVILAALCAILRCWRWFRGSS
jgi:hypothetical protein